MVPAGPELFSRPRRFARLCWGTVRGRTVHQVEGHGPRSRGRPQGVPPRAQPPLGASRPAPAPAVAPGSLRPCAPAPLRPALPKRPATSRPVGPPRLYTVCEQGPAVCGLRTVPGPCVQGAPMPELVQGRRPFLATDNNIPLLGRRTCCLPALAWTDRECSCPHGAPTRGAVSTCVRDCEAARVYANLGSGL